MPYSIKSSSRFERPRLLQVFRFEKNPFTTYFINRWWRQYRGSMYCPFDTFVCQQNIIRGEHINLK